jgi:hypothetical protein
MATTAASLAALTGLAAWANAKYHIAQDVSTLRFIKGAEKHYGELGMYAFPFELGAGEQGIRREED